MSTRQFRQMKLFRLIVVIILQLFIINSVQAEDFKKLDEAIPGEFVAKLAPVFDFDTDSCFPSAGISQHGQINLGLNTTDNMEPCRSKDFLDTSNTIHRYACTLSNCSKYCGHFYALYFEKDYASGWFYTSHRHDWEHVAVWTTDGVITHGSVSGHGGMYTKVFSDLPLDKDGHIKVVYHQDGVSTHAMRFAKRDELAENPYGRFITPTVISWYELSGDSISNEKMRTKLNNFNYGNAVLPLKRSNFFSNLNKFKPSTYPNFQLKEDCHYTNWFSEEESGGQMCPDEYVVTGIKCAGDFCDNKQLQCCRIPGLKVSGSPQYSPYFSEEGKNYYMNDREVVVGMKCTGKYCDNISLLTRKAQGIGGIWADSFSEEVDEGMCSSGSYVSGIKCTGRYCDNLNLYCQIPTTGTLMPNGETENDICFWRGIEKAGISSHQKGAPWCESGSLLTALDLDGDRCTSATDTPLIRSARCCNVGKPFLSCSWVSVFNSHQKGAAWCPQGSFITSVDLDGGGSAYDYPIIGSVQCCKVSERWSKCLWVEVGAVKSRQPWTNWCPPNTYLTALDQDSFSKGDAHDSPIIGRAMCCSPSH